MPNSPTRRDFLQQAGLAAGWLAAGRAATALGADPNATTRPTTAPTTSATEKIVIGLIGCGQRGRADLSVALAQPNVLCAGVCDVDTRHLRTAQADVERAQGTTPEGYRDYRALLDRQDIDAVIVATPDHWHALNVIAACQAEKDVYCETPLSHTVAEGRAMAAAATGRVVQVGVCARSNPLVREGIALMQAGEIGQVARALTLTVADEAARQPLERVADAETPAELDYDLWLGPAPQRPYQPARCHRTWRWFFDYGGGPTTERHVTLIDILQQALGQAAPTTISAEGGTHVIKDIRESFDTFEALCQFDGCTHRSAYNCSGAPIEPADEGTYLYGTRGTLHLTPAGYRHTAKPGRGGDDVVHVRREEPTQTHARHMADFFTCVRSCGKPAGDIAELVAATTTSQLTKIAFRAERSLHWDSAAGQFTNGDGGPDEAANALLTRDYRAPWKLPTV